MRNNIEKFLFLGVMIAATFFLNRSEGGLALLGESRTISAGEVLISGANHNQTSTVREEINPTLLGGDIRTDQEVGVRVLSTSTPASISRETAVGTIDFPEKENDLMAVAGLGFRRISSDQPDEVLAQVALISDLLTQEVYFSLNADKRWPTASISKLMTAVVAVREFGVDKPIVILNSDISPLGEYTDNLSAGESYTTFDLVEKMLVASSNETAEVLANHFGRESFMNAMNETAKSWSLSNTYFKDPSGISVSNQSTALDLQRMAKNIYESYPDIFVATKRGEAVISEIESGRRVRIKSNNQFAGQAGFLGGKTGFTNEANGNLLSIFSYQSRPVLVIILGSDDRFGETEKLYEWFRANFRAK